MCYTGNILYQASLDYSDEVTNTDDKIVATLAQKYFKMSLNKRYRNFRIDVKYLDENVDDLLLRLFLSILIFPISRLPFYGLRRR